MSFYPLIEGEKMVTIEWLLSNLWRATLHLAWVRGKQYWVATNVNEQILVDHEIYHRVLKEELAKRGIELKTWSEYMRPAEEAWKRQWAIEQELRSNFDFWKQVSGVQITTLNQEKQES